MPNSFSLFQRFNSPIRNWQQQRIWIIGASSGIGEALAKEWIQKGAKVALSARRTDQLEALQQQFPEQVLCLPLDVTIASQWQTAWLILESQWQGVDCVIYCAAYYQPERTWEMYDKDTQAIFQTNVLGCYRAVQTTLPYFLEKKAGRIAIIASVAGYIGLPQASVYGPSKAALINFAEILYNDLQSLNIQVHLINPGFVQTALTAKNTFTMPALLTTQQAAQYILRGIENGAFEIHFPKRFTYVLKLLKLLPYRLQFFFVSRLVKQKSASEVQHKPS